MAFPAWRVGATVRVRGRRWRVDAVDDGEDCTALRLSDTDAQQKLTILTPFDRPLALERSTTVALVRPRRWLHDFDRVVLDTHAYGALAHLPRTGIRMMPYQLEPALATIRHGVARLLIADGVGLGKTIQAGIVLQALSRRTRDSFRALVLTPAGLREQWTPRAATPTSISRARSPTPNGSARTAAERPAGINPWSLPGIYVASHDFVKRPEALRALEDVTWDIVVVDEAHAAAAGTDRARRHRRDRLPRRCAWCS